MRTGGVCDGPAIGRLATSVQAATRITVPASAAATTRERGQADDAGADTGRVVGAGRAADATGGAPGLSLSRTGATNR